MVERTFEEHLKHLEEEVQALGGLVEGIFLESVDLLVRSDLDSLEKLGADVQEISRKRLSIEMACLNLIATQRPLDGDLRALVAMLEIASELERVGEHAKRIARANCWSLEQPLRRPHVQLHRLTSRVQALLDKALTAFAARGVVLARAAVADVAEVDLLYRQVHSELLTVMKSKPRIVNQAIYLSRAAYNLKRAAERVAGISEWVIFIVLGTTEEPRHVRAPAAPDVALLQERVLTT